MAESVHTPTLRPDRGPWIRQKESSDNARAATANLLVLLGMNVPKDLATELNDHPEYPGLTAVMDCLDEIGVKARAVQGELNDLPSIDYPNMAHLEMDDEGRFVVLCEVDVRERRLVWLDPEEGWKEGSWDEFGELWTGVIMLASAPARRCEPTGGDSVWMARSERLARWTAPFLIAAFLWPWFLHLERGADRLWFALKVLGLALSSVLAFHHQGLGKDLCPAGEKFNCTNVLLSPAARLFGKVPVADLGAVYFLWGIFVFLSSLAIPAAEFRSSLMTLTVAAVLAVPYPIFSIWYQGVRLRRWCWLCLAVQAVIVSEFLLSLYRIRGPGGGPWPGPGSNDMLGAALAAVTWLLFRSVLTSHFEAGAYKKSIRTLRDDPVTVETFLKGAPPVPPYSASHDISLGPEDAPFELVVVSHPVCMYCARTHAEIKTRMQDFEDLLTMKQRFRIEGKNDPGRAKALVPLSLWIQGQRSEALSALDACFDSKARAPSALPADQIDAANALLEAQTAWARHAGCKGTPTLFLNGRKLLPNDSLRGLRMFLRRARRFGADDRRLLFRAPAQAPRADPPSGDGQG